MRMPLFLTRVMPQSISLKLCTYTAEIVTFPLRNVAMKGINLPSLVASNTYLNVNLPLIVRIPLPAITVRVGVTPTLTRLSSAVEYGSARRQ